MAIQKQWLIGLKQGDEVRYIRCDIGGSLSLVTAIVLDKYNSAKRVQKLLNLGDLRLFGYETNAPKKFKDELEASMWNDFCSMHILTSFCLAKIRDFGEYATSVNNAKQLYYQHYLYKEDLVYYFDADDKKWYVGGYTTAGRVFELEKLTKDKAYFKEYKVLTKKPITWENFKFNIDLYNAMIDNRGKYSIISCYNTWLMEQGCTNVQFGTVTHDGHKVYKLITTGLVENRRVLKSSKHIAVLINYLYANAYIK